MVLEIVADISTPVRCKMVVCLVHGRNINIEILRRCIWLSIVAVDMDRSLIMLGVIDFCDFDSVTICTFEKEDCCKRLDRIEAWISANTDLIDVRSVLAHFIRVDEFRLCHRMSGAGIGAIGDGAVLWLPSLGVWIRGFDWKIESRSRSLS
ncbi:hypothetical protein DMJ13_20345 [halophilic archaeon]|nr:hypothetical protein DMJ13_20345 [halophilic archaeon]